VADAKHSTLLRRKARSEHEPTTRTRAIFKATIHAGELALPVKLYSAVEDRRVHFRLLHAADLQPVVQQLVNPRTGEPVPPEEVRKGYEVEPGKLVVLDPHELARLLEPPSDRRMEVTQVVPRAALPVECLDRAYWLGHDECHDECFALARALEEEDRVAIVTFTMRKRRYHGAVIGERGQLGLVTLLDPRGLVLPSIPVADEAKPLDTRELALAEQLVELMRAPFDPAAHHDEHRTRVLELVERKQAGEAIPTDLPPPPAGTADLLRALEESLRRAREPHVA
jgi:DNA end-binding protein Ku